MYAPKKIFFFDFDKMIPCLATRWGVLLSQVVGCKYALGGVVLCCDTGRGIQMLFH